MAVFGSGARREARRGGGMHPRGQGNPALAAAETMDNREARETAEASLNLRYMQIFMEFVAVVGEVSRRGGPRG
jgi:hypothetical protein